MMMVAIMWFDSWSARADDRATRLFRAALPWVLTAMVLEAFTWLIDESGSFPYTIDLAANTLYMLTACTGTVLWPAYLYAQLSHGHSILERPKLAAAVIAPLVAIIVLVLANCFTGIIFTVGGALGYRRGPLFFLPFLLVIAYLVGGMAVTLAVRSREESKDERARYAFLAFVVLIPLAGMMVQMCFYGWWLMWPCMATMLFLVYLNVQNSRIECDSLTRLGNRRAFDRRLRTFQRQADGCWCLFMVDVDGLKAVNDAYGHAAGDELLCRMADVLRAALPEEDAHVFRLGGDEFAALASCESAEEAEFLIARLEEARRENAGQHEAALEFSVGYAMSRAGEAPDELMQRVDKEMYSCKAARKRASQAGRTFAGRVKEGER